MMKWMADKLLLSCQELCLSSYLVMTNWDSNFVPRT